VAHHNAQEKQKEEEEEREAGEGKEEERVGEGRVEQSPHSTHQQHQQQLTAQKPIQVVPFYVKGCEGIYLTLGWWEDLSSSLIRG
jgi:hypothetical protein